MNRLISYFLVILFLLNTTSLKADEGMWLPLLVERLNFADMQTKGLQLTPEEIYSVNHSSIKDAIVSLNNGSCSASVISKEGLLLTNYHCLYDIIQAYSTLENNFIDNGFWAQKRTNELRCENLSATFLVRIEDVTQRITPLLNSRQTSEQRSIKVNEISKKIIQEATKGNGYNAEVKEFLGGKEYYIFVYETYQDVRLVGVPTATIGKFGGDTDNWTWPRYTADFSLCRIYTAPDGKPASYNKNNIPLSAKSHLPISTKGLQVGDFTFTLGYPAKTNRQITSYGIKYTTDYVNPIIIRARGKKLEVLKQEMNTNKNMNTMYAAKYSEMSNFYKYYVEQNKMLKQSTILQQKKDLEAKYLQWASLDPKRKQKYEGALKNIEVSLEDMKSSTDFNIYYRESIKYGPETLLFALEFKSLIDLLKSGADESLINTEKQKLNNDAKKFYKDFNPLIDKKIFIAEVQLFYDNVPPEQYPEILSVIQKKYKGNIESFANEMYEKSIFPYREKVFEMLGAPDAKKLEKDMGYTFITSFQQKLSEISVKYDSAKEMIHVNNNIYTEGLINAMPEKKFYSDANATMRLSYGKVTPSTIANSLNTWQTNLNDMMLLYGSKNPDYAFSPKLKEVYDKKGFAPYSVNNTVPICFLTDNDVSGGNSGSPVINGKGELIGLCFDLTKESTISALQYDPLIHRAVNTDIRFILFIINNICGATSIINELTINN